MIQRQSYCFLDANSQLLSECANQLLFNIDQQPASVLLQELQIRNSEALKDARPTLLMLLQFAESTIQRVVAASLHEPNLGRRLRETILREGPKLTCCHPEDAAVAVLNLYLRVRLHHQAALCRHKLRQERNKKREAKKLQKITC